MALAEFDSTVLQALKETEQSLVAYRSELDHREALAEVQDKAHRAFDIANGHRFYPLAELNYRYSKWKLNRLRKRFDVYSGGRADDWDHRVH